MSKNIINSQEVWRIGSLELLEDKMKGYYDSRKKVWKPAEKEKVRSLELRVASLSSDFSSDLKDLDPLHGIPYGVPYKVYGTGEE